MLNCIIMENFFRNPFVITPYIISFTNTYSMEGMWRCLHDVGSASSIQAACRSLMKLGVIAETDSKKHISDLIFSEWLRRNLV